MKRYRHKRTGAMIEVESEIRGEDWQEVVPANSVKTEENPDPDCTGEETAGTPAEETIGTPSEETAETPITDKKKANTPKTSAKKSTTKKTTAKPAAKRPVARVNR